MNGHNAHVHATTVACNCKTLAKTSRWGFRKLNLLLWRTQDQRSITACVVFQGETQFAIL